MCVTVVLGYSLLLAEFLSLLLVFLEQFRSAFFPGCGVL